MRLNKRIRWTREDRAYVLGAMHVLDIQRALVKARLEEIQAEMIAEIEAHKRVIAIIQRDEP